MKIVKTHKHWKLHQYGYPVALRWQCRVLPNEYYKILEWLNENRGQEALFGWHHENPNYQWCRDYGRSKRWQDAPPTFIGLRNEADVSLILLSANLHGTV
jgi:hypothetical protein